MKKKVLLSMLVFGASIFGLLSLNAAGNRVQIVSENYEAKQLSTDGMHITNTINTTKTNLETGDVQIDITIDNSKQTEIFYVIDNGKTFSAVKSNVIDQVKTHAKTLEGMYNIKQGIVTTTDNSTSVIPLDSKNIEMQLDSVKNAASSTTNDGEVFSAIEKANQSFSTNAEVKVIVVLLSSIPTDTTGLKETIDALTGNGIKIIAYGIDLADKTNYENIFTSATKYELTNAELANMNFTTNVLSYLPSEKPAISATVSFDTYILNNFDVEDVITDLGMARYEPSNKTVIWEAGNIKPNEKVVLTYTLSLKSAIDESIVETINLRTNRQIIVKQSGTEIGTYPAHDKIDDQVCSPTIMLLKESIDNPKTGVYDYIIFGACLFAVASITILILNNKNEFNRI